eukprot:13704854-Alexandrium_andersonii.AAC.1
MRERNGALSCGWRRAAHGTRKADGRGHLAVSGGRGGEADGRGNLADGRGNLAVLDGHWIGGVAPVDQPQGQLGLG